MNPMRRFKRTKSRGQPIVKITQRDIDLAKAVYLKNDGKITLLETKKEKSHNPALSGVNNSIVDDTLLIGG
jgi:hypothetical protein